MVLGSYDFMTVRRRLLLLVISLVVPASLASVSAAYVAWSGERFEAERSLQSTARAVSSVVDHRLSSMVTLLQALATSPALTTGDLVASRQQAIDAVHDDGVWVVLMAPSAHQLVNTLRPFGTPLPSHPFPETVRTVIETRQPVISNLFLGPVSGQYTIAVDVPVIRNGVVIYDLAAGVSPAMLNRVLYDQKFPESWMVAIFDRNAVIAARNHAPERFLGQSVTRELKLYVTGQDHGIAELETLEGLPVLAAYSRSSDSGWGVVIGVPRSELTASFRVSAMLVLGIGLALISAGVLFAAIAARRIAQPIAALLGPAAALGRGERVPVIRYGLREVDEVAAALRTADALLQQRLEERDRAEAALYRAKQEAEDGNRAKSRFLAAASHDLRQPLMAANLFFESLVRRFPSSRHEPGVEYLRQSLAAMNELLDALLDLSRVDTGSIQIDRQDFALEPLLMDLTDAWSAMAGARGLDFRSVPARVMVRSDPALIKRILRNLLDNAVKFTKDGRILLGCRRRGGDIVVQVWDTGVGIPADKAGQIFEEFYQIGNPGRDRRHGLGLGLSIVDRLARLLGHAVHMRSVEGRGSLFEIRLPMSSESSQSFRPTSARASFWGSGPVVAPRWQGRVVVIDDDSLVLAGLQAICEAWGCPIVAASGLDAAWLVLGQNSEPPPCLILADYRLNEGRTGVDAIVQLRERLGWPVPGLVMTGETIDFLAEDCHRLGLAVIQKPITASRLYERLASFCETGESQ